MADINKTASWEIAHHPNPQNDTIEWMDATLIVSSRISTVDVFQLKMAIKPWPACRYVTGTTV